MVAGDLLLDTNVLIHALNADRRSAVALLLEPRPRPHTISVITWMEVMAGAVPAVESETRQFLGNFETSDLNHEIAARAFGIRRTMRMKLPDAIIYATALVSRLTLVTYNTRDFPADTPFVFHPASE